MLFRSRQWGFEAPSESCFLIFTEIHHAPISFVEPCSAVEKLFEMEEKSKIHDEKVREVFDIDSFLSKKAFVMVP